METVQYGSQPPAAINIIITIILSSSSAAAAAAAVQLYRVAQKWHNFLYALTLPNINRFSKLFHCQNQ